MFKKVLIAEDIDTISFGIVTALAEYSTMEIHHAKYCDDALLKIKKAIQENNPYDLLISDLSFKADHTKTILHAGEELVQAVKEIQPEIRIIVYSIEDRMAKIKNMFDNNLINAYVSKGRNSTQELKKAIENVYANEGKYVPENLQSMFREASVFEIEEQDIELLNLLAKGYSQEEISKDFRSKNYTSASMSSVEKRINKLKIHFNSRNITHLISQTKDIGLI
ncbi:DNA-binding response regulator, NarL/FixJ family, contains REC and HTH domains [Paenimyroides ummariense]|uniref:DNA-binding response regulator, NarL/FixJ family, contains REC and HTH domains n=1 Tax=Paenimyroides ummariense TaxID=913024 RepID=A0A1I5B8Y1_9FLAO|nr:response regulator transcription factor [Paenimyroides ummariense]SFN71178.1 DNA-binding response regulator, NarL/FixJ family, contains REC and HTH domains [Paenimyroides ummariense]